MNDKARRPWRGWYNTTRWKQLRATQLSRQPWCVFCMTDGHRVRATVADHVTRHRGRTELFFSAGNLQSLCKTCHDSAKQSEERLGYSTKIGDDGLPFDGRHPFYG